MFRPAGSGTANENFESGNTYAVARFIQDRTGGPPHAIYTVFQVD